MLLVWVFVSVINSEEKVVDIFINNVGVVSKYIFKFYNKIWWNLIVEENYCW